MDDLLLKLAEAVKARPAIEQLPAGLREHAQQYEKMLLEDLKAQHNAPSINEVERGVLENFILPFLQKHLTTVTVAGAVTLVANYLQKLL